MSNNQASTLLGRTESIGRKYPHLMERIALLVAIAIFIFGYQAVSEQTGEGIFSVFATYCLFPFILLFSTEMIGRFIQSMSRD
ncbi:MAG: hypothetical protein ISP82_02875 [Candidatus Poseidoniaceae archaeon]|nr:hypothetical protein [Candidatus Poseidoniaceae archaeon]MBL6896252.1 hypothetical protein [Candidatus Poseidoniaceae archaeon]